MSKLRHIMKKTLPLLVHLKKEGNESRTAANFGESVVNLMRNSGNVGSDVNNEIFVNCETSTTALLLSSGTHHLDATSQKILLRRPPFCPINSLSEETLSNEIPEDIKYRGVHVGVAVLLESSDNCILLTRRAKTMRTFPSVWVPPGGHVDQGESLFKAGMRELQEETGINIPSEEENSSSILGLWESTFPPMGHLGLPKRHHIVVYLHQKLKQTAADISKCIVLETQEVSACAWICSCVAKDIVTTDKQFIFEDDNSTLISHCQSYPDICVKRLSHIDGIVVNPKGEIEKGRVIQTTPLFADVSQNVDNERVSTGTKYALKLWLDYVNNKMR